MPTASTTGRSPLSKGARLLVSSITAATATRASVGVTEEDRVMSDSRLCLDVCLLAMPAKFGPVPGGSSVPVGGTGYTWAALVGGWAAVNPCSASRRQNAWRLRRVSRAERSAFCMCLNHLHKIGHDQTAAPDQGIECRDPLQTSLDRCQRSLCLDGLGAHQGLKSGGYQNLPP